jgi:hypothetical protein
MSNNIFQHTNRYILITFSHASDAKLTDKIEINTFIGLLCLAGVPCSKKQILEELLGTGGGGIRKIYLLMNQRHFKIPIRCILD